MDQLHQLFARSLREIQAHASESTETAEGRYFINEAAHLLAALRLWAQSSYSTEQSVREILETLDGAALRDVAGQLPGMGNQDAKTASATVAAMAKLPSGHLRTIASYALRAM